MKELTAAEVLHFARCHDFTMEESYYICSIFYREKAKNNPYIYTRLEKVEDYIRLYDESGHRYYTWENLVSSEAEQAEGMSEAECVAMIGITIFPVLGDLYIQLV